MSVLVIIEHDNQNIKNSSLNTITAAKEIDNSVHAVVLGENCSKVSEQVSKCDGIEEVFVADDLSFIEDDLSFIEDALSFIEDDLSF